MEETKEYVDASTETDSVTEPSSEHTSPLPPAYTTHPEPINVQDVLAHAHLREHGHGGDGEDAYQRWIDATGVHCSVLEEEIHLRKVEQAKRGAGQSITRPWSEAKIFSGSRG